MNVVVLQTLVTDWTWTTILLGLGFGLYAAVVATGVAFVFRWYTARPIDAGIAILPAVALVATAVGLEAILTGTFVTDRPIQDQLTGLSVLGVLAVSTAAAEAGRRVGDHTACEVFGIDPLDVDGDLATVVRSAGASIQLTTPESVDDIDGYPPVDERTARAVADRTFLFPRRLSVAELEERIATRITEDFDVGFVQVAVDEATGITELALGAQPTGLGRALPPGTAAVAIRGDAAPAASTGDPVEVWANRDGETRIVTTGRFRAADGPVTTLVVDETDAASLSHDETYRLVTRPAPPDDSNEFVGVLRSLEETVAAVSVEAGSDPEGEFVGWLPGTALLVESEDDVVPLPPDRRTLAAGDRAFLLGTPGELQSVAAFTESDPAHGAGGEDRFAVGAGVESDGGHTSR